VNAALFRSRLQSNLRCSIQSCASLQGLGRVWGVHGEDREGVTVLIAENLRSAGPSDAAGFEVG